LLRLLGAASQQLIVLIERTIIKGQGSDGYLFEAFGGPTNLNEMIESFLTWAERSPPPQPSIKLG
jgi:hypothetical protein